MKLFQPNKKYTSAALHALGFCCAAILLTVVLFRLTQVFTFLGNLFSALSPIAYGLIFAYLLKPLSRVFERLFEKKMHALPLARILALVCTYICLAAILFCTVRYLIPLLVGDAKLLGEKILAFILSLSSTISEIAASLGFDASTISITVLLSGYYDAIISFIMTFAQNLLLSTYEIVLGLFLSAAVLYHREQLAGSVRRFVSAFFPPSVCRFFHRVATYSDKMFGKYVVGKIAETIIICVIYIIVLVLIDMPYAFLVAVLMTVTNLIPVIGAYIGGIPSALIICTVDPKMLFWFLVVFVGIEQVNANIIAPKIIGSILGLRAVWIMLSVALFGAFLGVWGMFLSAPLFSILYALVRDAVNAKLAKQGDSMDTDHYTDMFASTVPPRRRLLRARAKSTPSSTEENKH